MLTVVSTKGQIVLPAGFRRKDRIFPRQQFSMERLERRVSVLKRVAPASNPHVPKWLAHTVPVRPALPARQKAQGRSGRVKASLMAVDAQALHFTAITRNLRDIPNVR